MRIIWHMAAKDVRRMALPVTLWLVFMAAATGWFQTGVGLDTANIAGAISGWFGLMSVWVQLLLFAQGLIGYVITGAMVLEDSPVGTERFWLTRPAGPARMVGGKLLAGALLFVVGPIVVLLPIWIANGFGGGELVRAAGAFALWQAVSTAIALGVGSMARNLAEFVLWSVAIFAAYSICWFAASLSLSFDGVPAVVRRSRHLVVDAGAGLLLLGVLVQQYRARRRLWSAGTLVAGWLVACLVAAAWTADVSPLLGGGREISKEQPVDAAAAIAAGLETRNAQRPTLVISAGWQRDGFYAPAMARSTDGRLTFGPAPEWGHDVGMRALGGGQGEQAMAWPLVASPGLPISGLQFTGSLEIWRARAIIVGEMPLRVGAELRAAGGRTHLVGLEQENGRRIIYVEEHRPFFSRRPDPGANPEGGELSAGETSVDRYFLVDRAQQRRVPLAIEEIGALTMNGVMIRGRRLSLRDGEAAEGAVVVKVTIQRERGFERSISIRGLAFAHEEVRR